MSVRAFAYQCSVACLGLLGASAGSAQFQSETALGRVTYVSVDDWSGQGTSPAAGTFKLDVPFTLPCLNGIAYFRLDVPAGRGWLAVLLTAKSTGQRVRPAYVLEGDGKCWVRRIEVE
jgi:hypothetical protein